MQRSLSSGIDVGLHQIKLCMLLLRFCTYFLVSIPSDAEEFEQWYLCCLVVKLDLKGSDLQLQVVPRYLHSHLSYVGQLYLLQSGSAGTDEMAV